MVKRRLKDIVSVGGIRFAPESVYILVASRYIIFMGIFFRNAELICI